MVLVGLPVLVLGGSDWKLTKRMDWVISLLYLRYFDRVLFEAMDVELPGVHAMPIGFTVEYTKKQGGSKKIVEVLRSIQPGSSRPRNKFLAAYGKKWKYLNDKIPSRSSLGKWLAATSLGGITDVLSGC